MSQFTKKDFVLLVDCIAESLSKIVSDGVIQRYGLNAAITRRTLQKIIVETFAERLKYTNDNFDMRKFESEVSGILTDKKFFEIKNSVPAQV